MSVPRLSLAAFAAFTLLSLLACSREQAATLAAPEAYARAQAGTLTLIDVRPAEERRQTGVVKGALMIDMAQSNGEAAFVRQVRTALGNDLHRPIALLSRAGNRGANAQRVLREAGFTHVYNVREGMLGSSAGPGWVSRGLPVEPCPNC
ncbi:rhodanese-like domain-containing protein [Thiobacillus sedimenti]|uniref:Rhodanese-like domain-containing protein n=1 Tax=Thiobacillus sedimenti TaxID=3110231 RepID=A0ABZ1CIE5_9PROT|nr:rhodanese-like domain-containing protein [Thiobacillus sp. SCUT-2]WRS38783.1 rhodanese-like domain-containing protein [Thiobacillus sp. SCUT-2]